MIPFLKQVALHYSGVPDLCFVFPSRRAQVFFMKYYSEAVKGSEKPVIAPLCYTIDDFIYRIAGAEKTDKVLLLLKLYECYSGLYAEKNGMKAEPLDDFIFWGDVILKDFSDVDRYMVDPEHIFQNVLDYKKTGSDLSYLSPTQREAMSMFLSRISVDREMEANFLKIWDILLPLYERFRAALREVGMSYDGMVYRDAAEKMDDIPECSKFIFVGLNALDECEKKILKSLHYGGKAEFCWDFSSEMVCDPQNRSSVFIRENMKIFPQAFELDCGGLPKQKIEVVSVASGVAQAKQMYSILAGMGDDRRNERTAIVLPDENMLVPALNSIPESIEHINVSMGYSMKGSELFALMNEIAALQLHSRKKQEKWFFYYKPVMSIFSNGLFRRAVGDEAFDKAAAVRASRKYYVPVEDLGGSELFNLIFKIPDDYNEYLQSVIICLALLIKNIDGMELELDFAKQYHQTVARIARCGLPELLPATYFRLLNQLASIDSVPFKGEPLRGLQIMGPLETRAVDFDNIIILSCNEGLFPRHPVSASFIPGELRHAFGLPEYEYHDSMNAYYFYRLIQRAENVWMLYDSRMKNMRAGEESRYIKQLEMLYGDKVALRRSTAKSEWKHIDIPEFIDKTEEDISYLKTIKISPSAIKDYRSCPAKFYYRVVKGLKTDDELSDSLDARTLGTVFHSVMQKIYSRPDRIVTKSYLESVCADSGSLALMTEEAIKKELNTIEVQGRDIVYRELVVEYVTKCIRRDIEYLGSRGAGSFRIHRLEQWGEASVGEFTFHGVIDRMDSVSGDEVRIVDYKTGSVDEKAMKNINLQMYLYDLFVANEPGYDGLKVVNSIYSPASLFVSGVEDVPADEKFLSAEGAGLEADLAELEDLSVPFVRKKSHNTCEYCEFKTICGQ